MLNHIRRVLQNRAHAGRLLAEKLSAYRNSDSVIVAVPHGGVPVGVEMAKALRLPLEISFSRRIKHPANSDLSIGAVSLDEVLLDETMQHIPQHYILNQIALLKRNLQHQFNAYYSERDHPDLKDKNVILVDDVLRDPGQLQASLQSLKKQQPARIIVAAPVATSGSVGSLLDEYHVEYLFMDFHTPNKSQAYFPDMEESETRAMVSEARLLS